MSAAVQPARIGIFGGAFDPPHSAHRMLAQAALEQLQLDQLRIVPTGQAWHRAQPLSDAVHRVAMAKLAFADLPNVLVDARETLRSGPSYTVDTLREFNAESPTAQLFLVIGQDQVEALSTWREWRMVVRLAMICVASRADSTRHAWHFSPPPELRPRFRQLDMAVSPVSATEIRARVAAGQPVVPLVCAAVARYIAHHHLYQAA